jgi:NADPH:quinone reductase-like Zn-dependent oxidoreductase
VIAGVTPAAEVLDPHGAYAEHLVAPAEGFIEPKPSNLDFEQAASVGLAALTGLVSVDAIEPSEGDVVLIVGAAGGVGAYAVQLAAGRGATIVATALPEDEAWIRGLGASEVIDYSGDVAAAVRSSHPQGVDSLIVAVHLGEGLEPISELVNDGGRIATTVGGADPEALAERDPRRERLRTGRPGCQRARMAADVARRPACERSLREPARRSASGERRSRGKVAV